MTIPAGSEQTVLLDATVGSEGEVAHDFVVFFEIDGTAQKLNLSYEGSAIKK